MSLWEGRHFFWKPEINPPEVTWKPLHGEVSKDIQKKKKKSETCYPGISSPSSLRAFVSALPIEKDNSVIMTKGWFKILLKLPTYSSFGK